MSRLLPLALALGLLGSCASPPVVHDGVEVVVLRGHRHSRYCGHYEHENSWYYVRGHKHGARCGHKLIDGMWRIKE